MSKRLNRLKFRFRKCIFLLNLKFYHFWQSWHRTLGMHICIVLYFFYFQFYNHSMDFLCSIFAFLCALLFSHFLSCSRSFQLELYTQYVLNIFQKKLTLSFNFLQFYLHISRLNVFLMVGFFFVSFHTFHSKF